MRYKYLTVLFLWPNNYLTIWKRIFTTAAIAYIDRKRERRLKGTLVSINVVLDGLGQIKFHIVVAYTDFNFK